MKKGLVVVGLFVSALCVGGCVVFVGEETRGPRGASGATIAEIDAIGKLSFDSEKKEGYERIAQRVRLSPKVQVYLVEAIFDKLSFDSAKEEVLLTLIANLSFCGAAERAILEQIDRLAFENSKKNVLKAISDRKV